MTLPDLKRATRDGRHWLVTVRYRHTVDDVEDWATNREIQQAAQGAAVRRATVDGTAVVHQVRVPAAALRDEDEVEDIAHDVVRRIEA